MGKTLTYAERIQADREAAKAAWERERARERWWIYPEPWPARVFTVGNRGVEYEDGGKEETALLFRVLTYNGVRSGFSKRTTARNGVEAVQFDDNLERLVVRKEDLDKVLKMLTRSKIHGRYRPAGAGPGYPDNTGHEEERRF